MVGHTGNYDATIEAVEAVDYNLGRIMKAVEEDGSILLVMADHGNAEEMYQLTDREKKPKTSHTLNKVPFIICNKEYKLKKNGTLKDIIPTIVDVYEISKPKEMTGES